MPPFVPKTYTNGQRTEVAGTAREEAALLWRGWYQVADGYQAPPALSQLDAQVAALVRMATSATAVEQRAASVAAVQDAIEAGAIEVGGGTTATLAARQSRRARAELDAMLAETLPGSSLGPAILDSTPSVITGGAWVEAITSDVMNPVFRYTGAHVAQAGTVYPDTIAVTGTGLDSTFGTLPFAVEFTYDGARFEFDYKWRVTTASFRVWADGVIVGSSPGPSGGAADGNFYQHLVTLPDARRRNIRIECSGGTYFYGIYTEPGAAVGYPDGTKGPRAILFGDSYVEGTGADSDYDTFAYRLGKHMGWTDTWRSGSGGTGYLVTPTSPAGRKTLRQRVQTDVIDHAPNIVIVAAGLNDRAQTAATVGTEAGLLFTQLATGLPNAEIIVVGPWGPRDASLLSADTLAITAAIRAAAEAHDFYFIDPIAENWITGTGYVGAATGSGNADTFISADGTHATSAGQAHLVARLAGHLRALGGVA